MTITDRNLTAGTRLVARYKGIARFCTVQEDGTYKLDGDQDLGQTFKSLSAAGSAVMGGSACNGWRFWSLEGAEPSVETSATKPKTPKLGKAKKLIFKVPNQVGVEEGKTRYFCSACMKGFLVDGDETPEVCPEGHRADDPELTAKL